MEEDRNKQQLIGSCKNPGGFDRDWEQGVAGEGRPMDRFLVTKLRSSEKMWLWDECVLWVKCS